MTRIERQDIFDEGFKANKDYFLEMSACPYPEGSEEMEVWLDGWEEANDPYWD
jgi:ribosome modulation factor